MASSLPTRSQPLCNYWHCDSRGNIRRITLGSNERFVCDYIYRAIAAQLIPAEPWPRVYQFNKDIISAQLPLHDMKTYFKDHPDDFNKLRVDSPLPAAKDVERDSYPLIDLFLYIPLEHQENEESDSLVALPAKRYKALGQYALAARTPPEGSKAAEYRSEQGRSQPEHRMFDGRYNNDNPRENTGVPIEIFHNSFAEFQHDAEHVDLPSTKVMVNVIDLFDKSSAIYENEAQRLAALRPCLESILGISLSRVENADLTKPHATNFIDVPTNAEGSISRAVALIWEGKDEFGRGGSSPDVQAAQAVRRTWFQLASVLAGNRCCCPTFLLATGGPYIMVLGVVITQTVVVRRLTPWLPMVNVSYDLRPYEQVARVLVALKNSVSRLTQFWNGLPLPRDPQVPAPSRFHPWRTSYQTTNDHEVHFEYLHPLETDPSTVTFLARHVAGDKDLIVVKFVMADRYGEEAHNLLASKGYAPPLLYRGRLSRSCHWLSMVVMGYVDGHSLSDKLPITSVRSQIEAALRFMHEENFVFGDLRLQNVMVDSQQQVKLIDLDWAGIAGEARYPLRMNVHGGIRWARGMAPGELILKEHDWEMLDNMGLI